MAYSIKFTQTAEEDFEFFLKNIKDVAVIMVSLLEEIEENPFSGSGRPESLKHDLKGFWSRRITIEHRLVYKIEGSSIIVASCRFHYK